MQLIEIADLREKVIISMFAMGGFREGTLSKLSYGHVKEDIENKRIPIHIHVEAEITKGKYADYDTFLNHEASHYLQLYLQLRKSGSPDGRNPAEELNEESPLIRNKTKHNIAGIGPKQIRKLVHDLYVKAGLIKESNRNFYKLRTHSIRKFFKTQLLSLGIQPDYVDYMMGHKIDVYHDIQSKGVEFLRKQYATSGLSIKPKTKTNKIDLIKEMIRSLDLDPENLLSREALIQPARTYIDNKDQEDNQLIMLRKTLRELILKNCQ